MLIELPVRHAAMFAFLALSLGACVAPESRPVGVGLKLRPSALGESISLQQRLDVEDLPPMVGGFDQRIRRELGQGRRSPGRLDRLR